MNMAISFIKLFMSQEFPDPNKPPHLWLTNSILDRIHDIMEKLTTENFPTREDRVKRIFRLLLDQGLTIPSTKVPPKSQSKSADFRRKGNDYFQANKLDCAYEEYTKSIAWAPSGSRELSLAYANRSAVLFKANYMVNCVDDIDRALAINYPENLKAKLYLRKANCLQAFRPEDRSSIKTIFDQAHKWLEKADEKNQAALEKLLKESKSIKRKIKPAICHKLENIVEGPRPKLHAENPIVPGLSDAIELTYSEKYGRHCIAARDIKPGDILGIQKPYTKIVDDGVRYNICWHCGRQTWAGLPCGGCPEVIYCSHKCKDAAASEYHDIECSIIQELRDYGLLQYHLMAMRLVVLAYKEAGSSMEQLKKNMEQINSIKDRSKQGFTDGVMKPDKFVSSQGLIPLVVKRCNERGQCGERVGLGASILIAFFFAKKINVLDKNCEFLNKTLDNDDFEFLVCFADKNSCLTQNTIHEITMKNKMNHDETSKAISSAILPAFSFFNYSCIPQMVRFHHGDYTILTAIAFIKKGQQIYFTNSSYYDSKKKERQEAMKNDEYTCECNACVHDWPTMMDNAIDDVTSGLAPMAYTIMKHFQKVKRVEGKAYEHILKHKKLLDVKKYFDAGVEFLISSHGLFKENSNVTATAVLTCELVSHCGEMPFFSLE